MKSIREYIKDLIDAGKSASSVRFIWILVGLAIVFILVVIGIVLLIDAIRDGYVSSSVSDLSLLVTSLGSPLGAVGATKIFNNSKRNDSQS